MILESRIQGSRFFTDLRPLYSDGQQPGDQPRPRNFSIRIRIQGFIFEIMMQGFIFEIEVFRVKMILSMNFEIMIQDFKFNLKFYRKIMIQGKTFNSKLIA